MVQAGFKNILHISIFLIFNSFLAQKTPEKPAENKEDSDVIPKSDTVKLKPEAVADVVKKKADNIRNDFPNRMTYLNKNAEVMYQDMHVKADYISIDWEKNTFFARGKEDSNGKVIEPVTILQGGKPYETDGFNYNYKTRQAIAYNSRTEESEGVIVAEKTKKYNDSVFFMRSGKYTTDEYFVKKKDSVADYYLLAPNIKLIKGKEKSQVITGPIQMYIEQVPTPLVMPFAILPFSDKRSAGILIPSFGERQDVGFFLQGIGYYQPLGEHFDIKTLVDFYTKGSWNIRPEINYTKKYKYNGSFNADIGTTVRGIKGLSNYQKSQTYRITWRHTQDLKANPFFTFSASVDMVSNKFYNNTINNNYIFNQNVLNTQQNSNISITKRFLTLPITITGAASYSQNFSTGLSDLRLPQMNVAVNQFYLFKSKTGVRQGLLENLTVNTNLNLNNYVSVAQSDLFTAKMWDEMQTGVKNNITLGTNTTIAKYFTFSLGANIDNALTTKTLTRVYDPVLAKDVETINNKLAGYSMFSTSASVQTILYGTKMFKKGSLIQGIRHMMTPSFGFSFAPDFGDSRFGYYKNYYNSLGELTPYSIFEKSTIGSPTKGMVGALGFNIGNNIEMKVKSKSDSTGVKKVKIFESLNLSGSYNFAAKSHPWSMFNISGQTSFFDGKLNINSSLVLDPYRISYEDGATTGIRTEDFGHFSLQGFNVQMTFPLSDAIFGEGDDLAKKYNYKGEVRNENYYFDENLYARYRRPWTLNVNSNFSYTKGINRFGSKMASLGLDGNVKLTPYWTIGGRADFDMVTKEFAYTSLNFARDQRSFTITFNWVPFGQYKVYNFFIGIKANILSDALKYKENSFTQPNATF